MAHACVSTSASSLRFTAGFVSASPNGSYFDSPKLSHPFDPLRSKCIPFRYINCDEDGGKVVQVLMISSSSRPGLLFPKGGWENDETVKEDASSGRSRSPWGFNGKTISHTTYPIAVIVSNLGAECVKNGTLQDFLGDYDFKRKTHQDECSPEGLETRQAEASRIREKYPDRIPVIVEKAEKSDAPVIDKKNSSLTYVMVNTSFVSNASPFFALFSCVCSRRRTAPFLQERFQSIISQLFQYRIIHCGGDVDDVMANIIVAQLLFLDAFNPTKANEMLHHKANLNGYLAYQTGQSLEKINQDVFTRDYLSLKSKRELCSTRATLNKDVIRMQRPYLVCYYTALNVYIGLFRSLQKAASGF
ncbi:unnamed protein product [Thlaspi arvense]|uniref:Uncharacterized protein n=1 Tax=Thlaspi arvense TaxID=13288 RepID=A0AAU9T7J7_THLAR|nr:unnamed protein product [Thlaspi arvense]